MFFVKSGSVTAWLATIFGHAGLAIASWLLLHKMVFLQALAFSIPLIVMISPVKAAEIIRGHNGGNCTGCAWVQVSGTIEKGDAEKFQKFVITENVSPSASHNIVYLDSPGGNLAEGIKLGKAFRKMEFTTAIGRTIENKGFDTNEVYIEGAKCISACAYAFLGGKFRNFDSEKDKVCLGFHQFYNPNLSANNTKAVDAAQVSTQTISGIVIEYLEEMGAEPSIYSFASQFIGTEIGCVSNEQSIDLKISNTLDYFEDVQLFPFGKGLVTEVKAPLYNRKLRIYCTKKSAHLAFFIDTRFDMNLSYLKNGLFWSAGEATHPIIENTIAYTKDKSNVIYVADVSKQFALDIIKSGSLHGSGDYGRVLIPLIGNFSFDIKGDTRAIRFALENCIG